MSHRSLLFQLEKEKKKKKIKDKEMKSYGSTLGNLLVAEYSEIPKIDINDGNNNNMFPNSRKNKIFFLFIT